MNNSAEAEWRTGEKNKSFINKKAPGNMRSKYSYFVG